MLNVVRQLFCQMNENIKYVHFKSNEHLSEGLNGKTDLDLLLFEQDKEKMEKILDSFHFVSVISPKEQEYKGVEHWLGFDEESGKLIHLHIYYRLITGKAYIKEAALNWNEIAYKTSFFYSDDEKEIRIVSPEFEIILLLVRTFYKASFGQKILYNINFYNYISKDIVKEYKFLRKRVDDKKLRIMLKMIFTQINNLEINDISRCLSDNNFYGLYKIIKKVILAENETCTK